MSQTAERLAALNGAATSSLHELAEDAQNYREALRKLELLPPGSDDYAAARANLHVMVTVLMAHSTTTVELLDAALDALPDDDE